MNNISNNSEQTYSTSVTKVFWCHICKKEFNKLFIENVDVLCRYCGGNFCEEIISNVMDQQHPSHFQPYEAHPQTQRQSNNPFNIVHMPRTNRPRTTSSFLDMILGLLGRHSHGEQSLEDIINYIMVNDNNRYGNPPASQKFVENLEKIEVNELNRIQVGKDNDNMCSVCKDLFELKQTCVNLPCKHFFHDDCILPWLKERNSCPTCRFELPTDDADFEAKKKTTI